jgi:hypothetical protein
VISIATAVLGAGLVVVVALGSTSVLARLGFLGGSESEPANLASDVGEPWEGRNTEWEPLTPSGDAYYSWEGSQLRLAWRGPCEAGPIAVKVGPQNWGYLSMIRSGVADIGGVVVSNFCNVTETFISTSPVSSWLCYRFSEVWVRLDGETADAGFYRVQIPDWIESRFCPIGSGRNNPDALWWETVQAGLVPEFTGQVRYPLGGSPGPLPTEVEATGTETNSPSPSPSRVAVRVAPQQTSASPSPSQSYFPSPTSPSPSPSPSPSASAPAPTLTGAPSGLAFSPGAPYYPAATVTLSWSLYSCPTGYPLEWSVSVSNGSISAAPTIRSRTITLGSVGPMSATVTATCGELGSRSTTATLTIVPPVLGTPTTPSSSGPYYAGTTVTVSWPSYTCPAGYPLISYNETILGASSYSGSGTSRQITLGLAGSAVTVSYTVTCGGLTSPSSLTHRFEVVAEPDPPPPDESPPE